MNRPDITHPTDASDDPERRRRRSIASTFEVREDFEKLLALQAQVDTNPVAHARLEGLIPWERMSFGHYQLAREAALVEGLIDENGAPK